MDTAALTAAVDDLCDRELVPWLARLVELPSHTPARDDVEAAAAMLDETLAACGLRCERVPDPDGIYADHRIYRTAAACSDGARSLALVGHVDTVFPRSQGFLEFRRDEGDADILRGPGVLDMKGGLAVGVFALRALHALQPARLAACPLTFVVVTDEEVGSPSSRAMFERLAPSLTGALVLEAARDDDLIILERKGTGRFRIEATGRAAHAGNDHAHGVNAIHALALLVPRIEALTDLARGTTLNVGLISGGTSRNTVPEQAWCEVDVRVERASEAARVESALRALLDEPLPTRLADARLELSGGLQRPPMEASDGAQALRARYERHARAAGLGTGQAPRQGGGSDANLLAAAGVPAIDGLGPYGKGFHSTDEWCRLSSLRAHVHALAQLLAEVVVEPGASL